MNTEMEKIIFMCTKYKRKRLERGDRFRRFHERGITYKNGKGKIILDMGYNNRI